MCQSYKCGLLPWSEAWQEAGGVKFFNDALNLGSLVGVEMKIENFTKECCKYEKGPCITQGRYDTICNPEDKGLKIDLHPELNCK